MEDDVIYFVVAVDEGRAVGGLRGGLREEGRHFVELRDLAHGLLGVDVAGAGLGQGERFEEGDLAVVEPMMLAVGGEFDGGGVDAVEAGEGLDCIFPPGDYQLGCHGSGGERVGGHGGPGGGVDVRNARVFENAAVEELHDVEWGADDVVIFAEAVGAGCGDVGGLEGVEDTVFAVHAVRSL